MTYFNVSICRKLQEKGLLENNEMVWIFRNAYCDPKDDFWELFRYDHDDYMNKQINAFTLSDILSADNAIKLWGENSEHQFRDDVCERCGLEVDEWGGEECTSEWQVKSMRLVSIFQNEGEKALEEFLEKELQGLTVIKENLGIKLPPFKEARS